MSDIFEEHPEESPFTFINMYKQYHRYSTDAPLRYGEIMAIQLLGHALGYKPVNLIQPKEVHHNLYSVFIGKSTLSRKTTSQTLGQDIYPYERCLPAETSPEQLIVEMSEMSERMQFLGEFTGLLKGVTGRGYMSRFVELYNDLHGCPKRYLRTLRKKKGEKSKFLIENAYLSVNSTVTQEMLKQHLTEELVEGGFLPRWLLVHGEAKPRRRGRLRDDVLKLKENLAEILNAIVKMEDKNVNFVLDDEALERYNRIEEEAYSKYDKILPFAGRYLNYVISFADILIVSDAIGAAIAEGKPLYISAGERTVYTFNKLIDLIQLKQLTQLTKEDNSIKRKNSVKPVNCIIVSRDYIDRAWKLIKPSLDYAASLIDYVEVDRPTAKLMEYLRRVGEASHSKAMQYTHLNADQMASAVKTLRQMDYIEIINKEIERKGAGRITKSVYKWIGEK